MAQPILPDDALADQGLLTGLPVVPEEPSVSEPEVDEDEDEEELKHIEMSDEDVVRYVLQCRDEAEEAKRTRMRRNQENFAMYHMEHDFSHKSEGQSQEILSKQSMAVEQIASFFQQALVDMGDWWKAEAQNSDVEPGLVIKPHEVQLITQRHLEYADFFSHVGNGIKNGLLGALIITKIHGRETHVPKFVAEPDDTRKGKKRLKKINKKRWQLKLDLVRQQNFYPDPTGDGLYEIEDMFMDLHEVVRLSQGDDAIYDSETVSEIGPYGSDELTEREGKARETGQNVTEGGYRNRVKLTEFWGTILNDDGEVCYENCVCTIANDTHLIRKPTDNPNWHQESPYVVAPLLEVPNAVWPKALMDAPTMHNHALIEMYNLLVDASMKAIHGVSQIHTDWLDDPSQVSNGIKPGITLKVNNQCPPGGKVVEQVTTASVPPEGLQIMNLVQQEFNASALTNDLRSGVQPFRQVKATEVVAADQSITSIFQGVAKNVETRWIMEILRKSWMTTCQSLDDANEEEIRALLGPERADAILKLSPEERFANTVSGVKFQVYGISMTLNKAQDFRKLTTFLQTIGTSQVLIEEFTKKYSFEKLLGEIMTALDISKYKLEIPQHEQEMMAQGGAPTAEQQGGAPGEMPDQMSQTPQAGAGSLSDLMGGMMNPQAQMAQAQGSFPQSQFPAQAKGAMQ